MNDDLRAAAIHAESTYAMGVILSMQAANHARERQGHSHAYGEEAFLNAVALLRGDLVHHFGCGNSAYLGAP